MKLIGKKIVVELPEVDILPAILQHCKIKIYYKPENLTPIFNELRNFVISEVARMNQALEVDEIAIETIVANNITWTDEYCRTASISLQKVAQALVSNPSAWLKRKDVVE